MNVRKSDGSLEEYSKRKLNSIVKKVFKSAEIECNNDCVKEIVDSLYIYDGILCSSIRKQLEERFSERDEKLLKAYRADKDKKVEIQHFTENKIKYINKYKKASNTANATIDDNSNVGNKNIGVLNAEIHKEENIQISRRMIMEKLKELYPGFNPKNYIKDLNHHIIYKHDESSFAGAIAPYCVSLTMYPFLTNGLKNIGGLSAEPKNIDSYCGMYCNLIFAVSSQFAGAVATSEALLYFTYFCKKEWGEDFYKEPESFYKIGPRLRTLLNKSHYWVNNAKELAEHDFGSKELNDLRDNIIKESCRPLTDVELQDYYEHIKEDPSYVVKLGDGTRTIRGQIHQYWQQIVYTLGQPASSRGFQSPFVNFSYFDKPFFEGMFGNFYFPDGTKPDWESLKWIEKEFMMWFNKERLRCLLTFPVESFTLLYKDGKFEDEEMYNFVCEEYARGHSLFTYISDSVDSLSSCCRLKNKLQTKEFNFTNGNIGVQTGSKSVITLNLSRIIQDWFNGQKDKNTEYKFSGTDTDYDNLNAYVNKILERVYKYHTAYDELLWDMYDSNLLSVYKAGFISLEKQYLTIGINGLNQAAEFLGIACRDNEQYSKFCQKIFGNIKEQNQLHKVTEGRHKKTFNTEQVPAESLAVKNYNWDKEDGYWVPTDTNLYASYVFKPNENISMLEKIRLMGKNFLGEFMDGGAAAHLNCDSHLSAVQYGHLLKYAAENGCNYITWNVPNCQCEDCGFIAKQPFEKCPHCGSTNVSLWDRIIGYLTKIKNWSDGRQIEQKTRIYEHINQEENLC